jgi:predicted AAA+ superfamily ATPase
MFTRLIKRPDQSFFLFGPRGTGKSTLLRTWFPDACWFDLLDQQEIFRILQAPDSFARTVEAQPRRRWIVVDEVQRAPHLLDEVHRLGEKRGYRFALSGSSARKLKHGGANLLAGRAFVHQLFPITWAELSGQRSIHEALRFGGLPRVLLDRVHRDKVDRLRAYVGTYLAEEIKAEALTRNLAGFSRFLTVAALTNSQVTNLSNIARDAGVARSTVDSYFAILCDTLVGVWLPAWQPRLRIKEVGHPKFYFFDCGVLRTLLDRVDDRPTPGELGVLLETLVLNELRAAIHYQRSGGTLSYWRTQDGIEIDFIWTRGERVIAIEVKATDRWRSEFSRSFAAVRERFGKRATCYGVYLGPRPLRHDHGIVLPVEEFLSRLASGSLLRGR